MDKSAAPLDLRSSFIVLDKNLLTDTIWSGLEERCGDFAGYTLITKLFFRNAGSRHQEPRVAGSGVNLSA